MKRGKVTVSGTVSVARERVRMFVKMVIGYPLVSSSDDTIFGRFLNGCTDPRHRVLTLGS